MILKREIEKIVSIVAERAEIPLHIQKLEQLVSKDRLTGFSVCFQLFTPCHQPELLSAGRVGHVFTSIRNLIA